TEKTILKAIKTACEEIGIPKSENIVFHSLKSVGINWTLDNTNDIVLAAKQGNHSSINTTMTYVNKKRNLSNMAGVLMENEISKDIFRALSYNEMLNLLESFENGVGMQLRKKAQEIIEDRKIEALEKN